MNVVRSTSALAISAEEAGEDSKFPYWRGNTIIVTLTSCLTAVCFAMAWPFLPLMVRDLGIHENLETWVGNMMLIFYVFMQNYIINSYILALILLMMFF